MNPLVMNAITKDFPGFTLGPIDFELPRGYVTRRLGSPDAHRGHRCAPGRGTERDTNRRADRRRTGQGGTS